MKDNLLKRYIKSYGIIESITWVTLGFLPMLGSMEVAWRLGKRMSKKFKAEKVPVHVILQK